MVAHTSTIFAPGRVNLIGEHTDYLAIGLALCRAAGFELPRLELARRTPIS